MYKAPLYEALAARASENRLRFHMPGHKGMVLDGLPLLDISLDMTELPGTGSLYEGIPPVSEAEELCAKAWGAKQAFFLTGGSSQGVRAAVFAAVKPGGRILCDRNVHTSLHSALVMLDLEAEYIEAEAVPGFGAAGSLDPAEIERKLSENPDISGIFITSPSYYGVIQDIPAIAGTAKAHGVPLIVDEAHGAHLPFLEGYAGAVAQGADLAVCSMHKTLPALGQSALLTAGERFPAQRLRYSCSLFGSASPSYLMMANMDLARAYMEKEGRGRQKEIAGASLEFQASLHERGLDSLGCHTRCDPMRVTVNTASAGFSGYEALEALEKSHGIAPEMADIRNLIFILSVFDSKERLDTLFRALSSLAEKGKRVSPPPLPGLPAPAFAIRPREAALSPERGVPLSESCGKIASRPVSVFPPGIQLIGAGERIKREHIEYLLALGKPGGRIVYIADK